MSTNVSIIWNGNGIVLGSAAKWERGTVRRANHNVSDGGISETVGLGRWDEVFVEVQFVSRVVFNQLEGWWAWAEQGKQYQIMLDDPNYVFTTLVNNESVGATIIEVASTAGISTGRGYRIQNADRTKFEMVEVTSISPGVSVTVNPSTKYAYSAGDTFRDKDSFAKAVSLDDKFPCEELPGLSFLFRHRFREDFG